MNPKTGVKLRFDFYLPEFKTLVEFDGNQHKFRLKGMSRTELVKQMYRDELKNKWALDKGYTLIRIPSGRIDEIENILLKVIKKEGG